MAKSTKLPPVGFLGKLPPQKVLAKYLSVAVIVFILAVVLWRNKSLFVVALVNGQPVTRLEFENRLVGQFGAQTLDQVINERLILQEGQKKGIKVTDKEIANKVAEIDKSLGGKISLADALAGQGLSMAEFQRQIRLQLTLEKLAGASIVISDKDVTDYLDKNRSTMMATDEAGLREEAKGILTSQRKNETLRKLFGDLKNQAKIVRYL